MQPRVPYRCAVPPLGGGGTRYGCAVQGPVGMPRQKQKVRCGRPMGDAGALASGTDWGPGQACKLSPGRSKGVARPPDGNRRGSFTDKASDVHTGTGHNSVPAAPSTLQVCCNSSWG